MQHDPINLLRSALSEFDDVLRGLAPAVQSTLRPGLADEAIDTLSEPLLPFVLPPDLRASIGGTTANTPTVLVPIRRSSTMPIFSPLKLLSSPTTCGEKPT